MIRVAVIIPAFNEERTVGEVVRAALSCPLVQEVVVVSDGSEDNTVGSANRAGARVIELKENRGKGGAMEAGLEDVVADIILFLDADLLGLTSSHVENMLRPLIDGQAEVAIGVFGNGRIRTDLAQKIAPFLSGQRAIKWHLLANMPDLSAQGYGVEVALTKYIKELDIDITEVVLRDVTQVMKEEKVGLLKGLSSRFKMYWEIARALGRKGTSGSHD